MTEVREPGWYWVKYDRYCEWEPEYFDGERFVFKNGGAPVMWLKKRMYE